MTTPTNALSITATRDAKLHALIGDVTHIISAYTDPGEPQVIFLKVPETNHLTLNISYDENMLSVPQADSIVAQVLEFVARAREEGTPVRLLAHCATGDWLAPSLALVALLGIGFSAEQALEAVWTCNEDASYEASLCAAADAALDYDGALLSISEMCSLEVISRDLDAVLARLPVQPRA